MRPTRRDLRPFAEVAPAILADTSLLLLFPHEIEAVLGEPAVDLSWGEMGEWYYGPALDGSEIVITFDYGLLRSIEHSRGVIASTRRK